MVMSRLLFLAALVGSTSALTCFTCDSFLTCNNPQIEHCPVSTTCFTLRRNEQVAFKGCISGCMAHPAAQEPGALCTECNVNNCNGGNHGISSNPYGGSRLDQQQPAYRFNNNFLKKRRSIGHGAGVQQHQIGSGAYGSSGGTYNAYGNNGGHHEKHKHQNGHGGIGGGAAPANKHHHGFWLLWAPF